MDIRDKLKKAIYEIVYDLRKKSEVGIASRDWR